MIHIVAKYICEAFMRLCGNWQDRKPEAERQAMLVDFTKRVDFDKEEGYRHYELMIYAPANYVQVWVRETWNVIPIEDLEYNEVEEETLVKKGKGYVKGASSWQLIGNHDSCWRDAVGTFLRRHEKQIDTVREPWKMVPASQVPEMTEDSRKGPFEL